ncbi:MAG: hypothetical protein FJ014_17275 [Chloroflexi bacterium]|nr:hypothetical protein [Chloroflexota bacterium]
MNIVWNDKKQARLDALRAAELAGTLDEASKAELTALIESLEAEERERLAPALAQMQAEQAALRQQVQESEAANEQLVILAAQQEQLLADARRLLRDLQRRHQAIQEAYHHLTGEPLKGDHWPVPEASPDLMLLHP